MIKYDIIKFNKNIYKKDTTHRMICQEFMRRFLNERNGLIKMTSGNPPAGNCRRAGLIMILVDQRDAVYRLYQRAGYQNLEALPSLEY